MKGQQGPNKPLLSDNSGEMYYELIIKTLIWVVFFLTVINVYQVFIQYQQTNYLCRRVVRAIEVEVAISSDVYEIFDALKTELNLPTATMNVTRASYFDSSSRKIQLRGTFTISVVSTYDMTIINPLFTPPVIIPLSLTSTLSGMSEVFWKT